ncbi:hypothetical protein [Pantoea phage LIMEzero]|uniref:Internal virion protein n=1 Tax=Pantoea phage LIMEzero TaxID=943335 RepID=F4N9U7_9CAUD|nr:internal virion lysozyme motif [Pantoea phage LIMEzero]CBY88575.1 hypothetical protein [Pantoea phage LIMEzero]
MAVMRDQQGANLDASQMGRAQIQQSRSPMDYAGRDTSIKQFDMSGLRNLMNTASAIAGKVTQQGNEAEYLKGATAAATGQSLDALDSNLLTKQFQTAGYSDQSKRMELAQQAAKISAKMPQYAAMDPEEFLGVVQQANQDLFANTDGMSMRGRRDLLDNQLTNTNTLIRTQAATHGAYLVNQRSQMYNAQGNTLASMVAQAKSTGDGDAYAAGIGQTMQWVKSIMTDPQLPMDAKQKQVTSMMGLMLQQDSRTAVESVVNSGLLNTLPPDQLASIQSAIRESKNRTQLQDNQGLYDQFSQMRARQDTYGDVPVSDFNSLLTRMADARLVTGDGYMAAQEQYLKNYAKNAKAAQLGNSFAQGDQTGMLRLNATPQDAADAYIKTAMKQPGATSASVAGSLLSIGMATGQPVAYQRAAGLIEPGLTNFGTVGQMNPDAAQSVTGMLDRITVAEQHGDTTAFSKLLSGLTPENQEKLVFMREQIKSGKTVDQAGQDYIDQQNKSAGLTPAQKTQILAQKQTEINKAVNAVEGQGFLSRTWQGLAGIFSDQSRNQFQARVASGDITASQELGEVSAAYREELQAVVLRSPNVTTEQMEALAQARLANRVLRVGETTFNPGSVLVAPRGQTAQSMLGLPANASPDRIGSAIAALDQSKAPDGYSSAYSFMPDGTLAVQYINKKGEIAPNTVQIPASAIRQRMQEDDRAAATANNDVYGEGKLFVDPKSNVGIRVNGVNTAGVDEQQMLQARGALISLEGIRNTTYRDTTGVATNGVGISSRSPEFAGRGSISGQWSARDIHDSFVNHTNMVARSLAGTSTQLGWSVNNNAQFQFMMQIGYQGGTNWYRQSGAYGRLADAIRTGSPDVMAALHQTPAYKLAGPERQKFYESSLMAGLQK